MAASGPGAVCTWSDSDSVTVTVTGECAEIFVPNGFSPNGDNNNDVFYIFGLIAKLDFTVFDRWGQVVFATKDQAQGWDGTFNGKKLESGIYAYKLTLTNSKGVVTQKAGNITLMR
jgi:gliding motility-associated-like protein